MSSPYAVLGNRPIDQWKVVELKEELKKRKLTTKGLKEDLVKRLDEAVRSEFENAKESADEDAEPELPSEPGSSVNDDIAEHEKDTANDVTKNLDESMTKVEMADSREALDKEAIEGEPLEGGSSAKAAEKQVPQLTPGETDVVFSDKPDSVTALDENQDGSKSSLEDPPTQLPEVDKSEVAVLPSDEGDFQLSEGKSEPRDSKLQLEDVALNQPDPNHQVSEVNPDLGSQITSDPVSTESVSIIEKSELKVGLITDDVKLELEVKHESVQQQDSNTIPNGGKPHPMDVEEPQNYDADMYKGGGNNTENVDSIKKIDGGDLGSPEKLNLDRSSGDDSMDEDILDVKQVDSKPIPNELTERVVKTEIPIMEEKEHFEGDNKQTETVVNVEDKIDPAVSTVKRKFSEPIGDSDIVKRQRRWNTESLKVPEPQSTNAVASTTPKDIFQPNFRRSFSRSESTVSEEPPKDRVVPPSQKQPTNSLRIDNFLRPFTLKAVQELLGKTGTVTSFWMDNIKTHCYVSYSSMEEAVETRNAVYNLQWPPNGGRMLVADFVGPEEVEAKLEAPLPSPAAPLSNQASISQPAVQAQPSPRLQGRRLQAPPLVSNPPPTRELDPLPRDPPSSGREQPLPARERLNLPPPPPLPEKVDPPILTLDDLFQKTKATPRIYYLPLSEEQVTAKLKAQGQNTKQ